MSANEHRTFLEKLDHDRLNASRIIVLSNQILALYRCRLEICYVTRTIFLVWKLKKALGNQILNKQLSWSMAQCPLWICSKLAFHYTGSGRAKHSNRSCYANSKYSMSLRCQTTYIHQRNGYNMKMRQLVVKLVVMLNFTTVHWSLLFYNGKDGMERRKEI